MHTPQMTVDGREQFVDSRIQEAKNFIRGRGAAKQDRYFACSRTSIVNEAIHLTLRASKLRLVSRGRDLSLAVGRGDNAGKSLYHAAVPRTKLFLILCRSSRCLPRIGRATSSCSCRSVKPCILFPLLGAAHILPLSKAEFLQHRNCSPVWNDGF